MTKPTSTDEFTKRVESALKKLQDWTRYEATDAPAREGDAEQALASIQTSTVELLEGIRPRAHKLMEEGYRIDIALQIAVDQLIKDLTNG